MAKKFLDQSGLSHYDSLIKNWINQNVALPETLRTQAVDIPGYSADDQLNWNEEGFYIDLQHAVTNEFTVKIAWTQDVMMRGNIYLLFDLGVVESGPTTSNLFPTVVPQKTSLRFYSANDNIVGYVNNIGAFPVFSDKEGEGQIDMYMDAEGLLKVRHSMNAELYCIGFITFRITGGDM